MGVRDEAYRANNQIGTSFLQSFSEGNLTVMHYIRRLTGTRLAQRT
jgi:hypothetical protein